MQRLSQDEHKREGAQAEGRWSPFVRAGVVRRILRYGGILVLMVLASLIAGFLVFADHVTNLRPPDNVKADAIVVLTGGYQRIEQAIELLRDGAGERLLISGVNPQTTAGQLRRTTGTSSDLFACCIDMGYAAIDTIGNANETALWIRDKGYRSVLVVTSNYHLSRSLMELRHSDKTTEFIGYPVVNADLKTRDWYSEPAAMRTMLAEYGKTVLTYLRLAIGWDRGQGLRPEQDMPATPRRS